MLPWPPTAKRGLAACCWVLVWLLLPAACPALAAPPRSGRKYDRDNSQYAVVVMNPTTAHMADVSAYTAGTKKISMKFRSPGPGTAVRLVLQNKSAPWFENRSNYLTDS